MNDVTECFFSVDVETAGPIPGEYSMMSLGACVVGREQETFYQLFKPINTNFVPAALEVSKLSLEALERDGQDANVVMRAFRSWLLEQAGAAKPVFVGFNAPFDWSFVNYYFHRFGVENPFGFTALDIKALYMGATGCSWNETRSSMMSRHFGLTYDLTHNALDDAIHQSYLFQRVLEINQGRT